MVGNAGLAVGSSLTGSGDILVTGAGSLLRDGRSLFVNPNDWTVLSVGSNGAFSGNGSVLVTDGGTIEYNRIVTGFGSTGSITNNGGVFQFTTATPFITNNNFAGGSIVVEDGIISFRNITNADPTITGTVFTNITFVGNNTFMLNAASNATGLASYTFDSGSPATTYQRLALHGTNPHWRSTTLTIASGGAMLVTNAIATVGAALTIDGEARVVNSHVTYQSNVVLSGSYLSDPSTNTFLADLTVTESGSLAGGVGDLFDFKKSLLVQSTNNMVFDLSLSTVSFSGGGNHTNAVTGGDFGSNSFPSANFAYGELKLETSADQVYFISGGFTNGMAGSNALYVSLLSLPDEDTNFVADLHSPFNIYYLLSEHQPGNAYLNDLTYSLDGGGLLLPVIPEPSTLALVFAALGALFVRRTFRARN